jgi:hypothetical protein
VNRCPICDRPIQPGQITAVAGTDDLDLLALDLAAPVVLIEIGDTEILAACVHTTEQELRQC